MSSSTCTLLLVYQRLRFSISIRMHLAAQIVSGEHSLSNSDETFLVNSLVRKGLDACLDASQLPLVKLMHDMGIHVLRHKTFSRLPCIEVCC